MPTGSRAPMLRPLLSPGIRTRRRSDGTFGVYDPRSSNALEVSADQARLLTLIEGSRTVPELAAEHLHRHGFVPFAALRDLLRSLASAGLLANPRAELEASGLVAKPRWMPRLGTKVLLGRNLPAATAIILSLGLAAWALVQEPAELEPVDVLLFTVGASLAMATPLPWGGAGVRTVDLAAIPAEGSRAAADRRAGREPEGKAGAAMLPPKKKKRKAATSE